MAKVIGIDLGTMNSCVSVIEENSPCGIPPNSPRGIPMQLQLIEKVKATKPSVVAFNNVEDSK